jgi:tetrahydromethanopterin S-methyltransferase subunit D
MTLLMILLLITVSYPVIKLHTEAVCTNFALFIFFINALLWILHLSGTCLGAHQVRLTMVAVLHIRPPKIMEKYAH